MTDKPRETGIVPANRARYRDEAELQRTNGRFGEIGSSGLEAWSGYIREAYHADLQWPKVEPLFSRIRRSDPEMAIVRNIFSALVRDITMEFEAPDDAGEAEQQATEFGNEVLDDVEGGASKLLDTMVNHVPFMGWGWWEVVPAIRSQDWRPPGRDDPWRSDYDDGRVGVRRFAWREHSSFHRWDLDDATGRLRGMVQLDPPNEPVTIPLARSLHLTFGDANNPEGLSPLEAVWRLERLKYGLEVVQGIGFEHAAGHVMFEADKELTDADKTEIKKVARALLTAQEGNYGALPKGITGKVEDVNFQAADSLLGAIKYYGLLKLQIYNMQWVALSTTSGTGSFAAMKDASSMFVLVFNSMLKGFAEQISDQLGRWLFRVNDFPGLETRPKLRITPVDKLIDLEELGGFLESFIQASELTDDDLLAIRRKSGFLPETLADMDDVEEPPDEPEPEPEPFPEPEEVENAVRRFRTWARRRMPGMARLLDRRVG